MSIDRDAEEPLYLQLAAILRGRIGQRARLVPLSATVWLIDAEGSAGS